MVDYKQYNKENQNKKITNIHCMHRDTVEKQNYFSFMAYRMAASETIRNIDVSQ